MLGVNLLNSQVFCLYTVIDLWHILFGKQIWDKISPHANLCMHILILENKKLLKKVDVCLPRRPEWQKNNFGIFLHKSNILHNVEYIMCFRLSLAARRCHSLYYKFLNTIKYNNVHHIWATKIKLKHVMKIILKLLLIY